MIDFKQHAIGGPTRNHPLLPSRAEQIIKAFCRSQLLLLFERQLHNQVGLDALVYNTGKREHSRNQHQDDGCFRKSTTQSRHRDCSPSKLLIDSENSPAAFVSSQAVHRFCFTIGASSGRRAAFHAKNRSLWHTLQYVSRPSFKPRCLPNPLMGFVSPQPPHCWWVTLTSHADMRSRYTACWSESHARHRCFSPVGRLRIIANSTAGRKRLQSMHWEPSIVSCGRGHKGWVWIDMMLSGCKARCGKKDADQLRFDPACNDAHTGDAPTALQWLLQKKRRLHHR